MLTYTSTYGIIRTQQENRTTQTDTRYLVENHCLNVLNLNAVKSPSSTLRLDSMKNLAISIIAHILLKVKE